MRINYLKSLLVIVSLLPTIMACSEDANNVEAIGSLTYALLRAKTETTVIGKATFKVETTFEYDTTSKVPTLQKELSGNLLTTYSYPSANQIVLKYSDNDTKKVYNSTTLNIDPTTKNVIKQIDEDKSEYTFEYDASGYLKKSPLEDGYTYTYNDGNLSAKTLKTADYTYTENYQYGSEDNKAFFAPYYFGKPNKKLITQTTTNSTDSQNKTTSSIKTNAYSFDKNGYVLTQRETLSNGGYNETTFEYILLKR